jgi:1-phosphatidylinositol phosphodiesterase
MFIKEEYNPEGCTQSFEDTCRTYTNSRSNIFYTSKYVPKLSDARGKVVILRRFDVDGDDTNSANYGIRFRPWMDDNGYFIIPLDGNSITVNIQDQYIVHRIDNKWNVIDNLLKKANSSFNAGNWYINFLSGTGLAGSPRAIAAATPPPGLFNLFNLGPSPININLLEYLKNSPGAHVGCLMLDFPFFRGSEIAEHIVRRNFL